MLRQTLRISMSQTTEIGGMKVKTRQEMKYLARDEENASTINAKTLTYSISLKK